MENNQPIIIKRVKRIAGGHHGGAWKIAFADFATAMMAFFLVLWLLSTATPEQKIAIAGYFKDPIGFTESGTPYVIDLGGSPELAPDQRAAIRGAKRIALRDPNVPGNPVLANYLRDINNNIRILRRLGFPDRQSVIETCEEHFAICELVRAKNKTQARKAMTKHIRKSQGLARSVTLSQLQQAIKRHKN